MKFCTKLFFLQKLNPSIKLISVAKIKSIKPYNVKSFSILIRMTRIIFYKAYCKTYREVTIYHLCHLCRHAYLKYPFYIETNIYEWTKTFFDQLLNKHFQHYVKYKQNLDFKICYIAWYPPTLILSLCLRVLTTITCSGHSSIHLKLHHYLVVPLQQSWLRNFVETFSFMWSTNGAIRVYIISKGLNISFTSYRTSFLSIT